MINLNWRMIIVLAILTSVSLLFLYNRSRKKLDNKNDSRTTKDLAQVDQHELANLIQETMALQTTNEKMNKLRMYLEWNQFVDGEILDWWSDYFKQCVKHLAVRMVYKRSRDPPELVAITKTIVIERSSIGDVTVRIPDVTVSNFDLERQKEEFDFLLLFLTLSLLRPSIQGQEGLHISRHFLQEGDLDFRGPIIRLQRLFFLFFTTMIDYQPESEHTGIVEMARNQEKAADTHWKNILKFIHSRRNIDRAILVDHDPLFRRNEWEMRELIIFLRELFSL
jgi:hypothetical protein